MNDIEYLDEELLNSTETIADDSVDNFLNNPEDFTDSAKMKESSEELSFILSSDNALSGDEITQEETSEFIQNTTAKIDPTVIGVVSVGVFIAAIIAVILFMLGRKRR